MKDWFLMHMIKICNYGLRFSDSADNQTEENDMIKIKNHFIKERCYSAKLELTRNHPCNCFICKKLITTSETAKKHQKNKVECFDCLRKGRSRSLIGRFMRWIKDD